MGDAFTPWMPRGFFPSIPRDLEEAAMVDGCGRFEAFRRVIVPVMGPASSRRGPSRSCGAATTSRCPPLLGQDRPTMVPRIASFPGSVRAEGDGMLALSAVVSATVPPFLLVMAFRLQIVGGLAAGAATAPETKGVARVASPDGTAPAKLARDRGGTWPKPSIR